jgi:predicted nucleic acid-binding protein
MIILDSNVWIAFFHERDSQHKRAEKIVKEISFPIVAPEYVIIEVSSILRFKAGKKISNDFLENIFDNENIEILLSNELFFSNTADNFKNSKNKSLSFVDTALLYLSKSYQVITFDKDLQKAINNFR